ncbi:hypothetical protein CTKZ_16330 [Cellulomonas algicola]|uniref:Lipoprotein n=1 Tax=Cellulomonas algicola TaxID=2071633 RepID=A0A401UZF2_9CELL|nr:hypothetical protein [Cellulomonas algicola]GCD20071.1 hypothetical protein CTKZ_16330 [Cellulomonas algicola]
MPIRQPRQPFRRQTRQPVRHRTAALVAAAACLGLGACTADDGRPDPTTSASVSPSPSASPVAAEALQPTAPATVLPAASAETAALEVVRTLVASAPVVVLADAADPTAQGAAIQQGARLGVPVLLGGPGVPPDVLAAELERLGTRWAVTVGATAPVPDDVTVVVADASPTPTPATTPSSDSAPTTAASPSASHGTRASASPSGTGAGALPRTAPPAPVESTVLLTGVTGALPVAVANAAVMGVEAVDVPGGDPRALAGTVQAFAQRRPAHVVALGDGFGAPDRLAARVATASTGVELPGGGQLVFPAVPGQPGKRYVALYGTPGTAALGVLGEQDVPATVARAQGQADAYRPLTGDTVVPAVEVIATIASAGPGPDGNYSQERSVDELRPLVEAAGAAGQLVILDLQPGRTDFVTQAQRYTDLLALPYVGLALDPEWRLAPDQVHLRQIGSVGIDEVNAVSAWLAGLTRERALPQKMLVLHQFSLLMISGREGLDTTHDELATVIHVDGQGSQPAKAGTWATLRAGAPTVHWGWKNFVDEDKPMLDPAQTYGVQPVPDLVTYQ